MLVIIVNLILQAKLKREQSNSKALFFEYLNYCRGKTNDYAVKL